jgi:hypothetical protein
LSFNFSPNRLQLAADQIIKHIEYTQSLALKDDKYQPFPNHVCDSTHEGITECMRSKYWFKQWWQIRFSQNTTNNNDWWYEVFTDLPYFNGYNFDKTAHYPDNPESNWYKSIALDPLTNKLLIGNCGATHYPNCDLVDKTLNLTKSYGIQKVEFVNMPNKRLLFDNNGNVFLKEGEVGDSNDTNPLDSSERPLLTSTAKIKLCTKINTSTNKCETSPDVCIQINISPLGAVYKSNCE